MQCEILVTEREGQLVAGTISFDGDKVVAHANTGFETLMQNVMDDSSIMRGKRFTREDDPQGWFKALPYEYAGSYMRARMLQTNEAADSGGNLLVEELTGGEERWVTLSGGQHILIGGEPLTRAQVAGKVKDLVYQHTAETARYWGQAIRSDYKDAANLFDRFNQQQLLQAHSELQKLNVERHIAPEKILPILVSRMDSGIAEKALAQSTGNFKALTEDAIASYGPARAAEGVIAANPQKYPAFAADPKLGDAGLVDAWNYGGMISKDQPRMQYIAGSMDGNREQMMLNYWAEVRGIAPSSSPQAAKDNMNAMYEKTQQYYNEKGVDQVTAYRATRGAIAVHSPLETWTMNKDAAIRWAGEGGFVLTASISKENIFWSADSEPRIASALHPQEVTVFGGSLRGKSITVERAVEIANPAQKAEFERIKLKPNQGMDSQAPYYDEGSGKPSPNIPWNFPEQ